MKLNSKKPREINHLDVSIISQGYTCSFKQLLSQIILCLTRLIIRLEDQLSLLKIFMVILTSKAQTSLSKKVS